MRHADLTVALTSQIKGLVDQLQGGAWWGVGAEAFYAEMRELILPAMDRLQDVLQFAGEGTGKIHHIMRATEEGIFTSVNDIFLFTPYLSKGVV